MYSHNFFYVFTLMMQKSIHTIDTVDTCIKLEVPILKLTYSIALSGFFPLVKYSKYNLKAKRHWETPMKNQFYSQSQQLTLVYIFFCFYSLFLLKQHKDMMRNLQDQLEGCLLHE